LQKNCTREETCHKCAGSHNSRDCTATKKKCVNCIFKIQTYNLKISDEHDALSPECPTFMMALQEKKRRAGRTLNSKREAELILYTNAQSLMAHRDKIQHQIMKKINPVFLVLSEIKLTKDIKDNEVNVLGYSTIRCNAEINTGGLFYM